MKIVSVNIGDNQAITVKQRIMQTGIYKTPATGPVSVSRLGLKDDVRVEVRKMGLEHSAVYAYPFEHYVHWQTKIKRAQPFPIGQFGENLTVTGLFEEEVRIGDIFRFGDTIMQVAHPRIPCYKLNARMGIKFASTFLASRKVGYYLRVVEEGEVCKNDKIELLERDESSPTVEEFVRIIHYEYWNTQALQSLLQARDLLPAWKSNIEEKIQRSQKAIGWHGLRELEVVSRRQESRNTISFDLKCAKNQTLSSFSGGQLLMFVSGKIGDGNQKRQSFYLSSSHKNKLTYRVSLRDIETTTIDADVSAHEFLSRLGVGDRIRCNAPFGEVRSLPENRFQKSRVRVLISQGLGIGTTLSLLYELDGLEIKLNLFHQTEVNEPTHLLTEVNQLIARNPKFEMFIFDPAASKTFNAEMIKGKNALKESDIDIAGPRKFIDRLVNEFMQLDYSPAALITRYVE